MKTKILLIQKNLKPTIKELKKQSGKLLCE